MVCQGTLPDLEKLYEAIARVESGAGLHNRHMPSYDAVNGDAVGPFQIRPIYLQNVNEINGDSYYKLSDRRIPVKCRQMMKVYWRHFATFERLGREPTLQDLARMHYGGPNGYRLDCTLEYWEKVRRELENGRKSNHGTRIGQGRDFKTRN
jgi:hypothetical protein